MKRTILLIILNVFFTSMFGVKRALVIGISEYRDLQWMKPRISAERDIVYVREILQKTGFAESDIIVLKNRQATKSAIVKAMKVLAANSNSGDIIYIHFSGHGQLMSDIDGDEDPNVFGEKWDESWVPYDASFRPDTYDRGEHHLCDDEVGLLLSSIRKKIGEKGELLVVIDACHSGDATREQEDVDGYYETVGDTITYANPLPVTRGTTSNFIIEQSVAPKTKKSKIVEDWISISACKAYQVNSEMRDAQGLRIGMLTYGLYTKLAQLAEVSNQDLEDYLNGFMSKNKHPESVVGQNPQVTGAIKKHHIYNTFRTNR